MGPPSFDTRVQPALHNRTSSYTLSRQLERLCRPPRLVVSRGTRLMLMTAAAIRFQVRSTAYRPGTGHIHSTALSCLDVKQAHCETTVSVCPARARPSPPPARPKRPEAPSAEHPNLWSSVGVRRPDCSNFIRHPVSESPAVLNRPLDPAAASSTRGGVPLRSLLVERTGCTGPRRGGGPPRRNGIDVRSLAGYGSLDEDRPLPALQLHELASAHLDHTGLALWPHPSEMVLVSGLMTPVGIQPIVGTARRTGPRAPSHAIDIPIRLMLQPIDRRRYPLRLHRVGPGPQQLPPTTVYHQEQVHPLVHQLHSLTHLDPATTPYPTHHPPQAHSHLIGKPQDRL